MLGVKLTQTPTGKQLRKQMGRIVTKGTDLRKPFRKIAKQVLIPTVKSAFASRTEPGGQAWAPLTEGYAKKKKKAGGSPRKILVLSGQLKKAATRVGKVDGGVRSFNKKSMRHGVDLHYAAAHFFGYGLKSKSSKPGVREKKEFKRSDVEPRSWAILTKAMVKDATDLVVEHQDEVIRKEALRARKGGRGRKRR